MYTRRFDWGSVVLGLRVEQTDVENLGLDGFVVEDDERKVLVKGKQCEEHFSPYLQNIKFKILFGVNVSPNFLAKICVCF